MIFFIEKVNLFIKGTTKINLILTIEKGWEIVSAAYTFGGAFIQPIKITETNTDKKLPKPLSRLP